MEHDKFCEYDGWMCQCAVIASARADERRRVLSTVAALRASAKKDENGWALYEHCYECSGAADGYDTAIDDALAAVRGEGESND